MKKIGDKFKFIPERFYDKNDNVITGYTPEGDGYNISIMYIKHNEENNSLIKLKRRALRNINGFCTKVCFENIFKLNRSPVCDNDLFVYLDDNIYKPLAWYIN